MTSRSLGPELRQIVYGYCMSQCIRVAASLGIADCLAEGPGTCDELAALTGSHPASLRRLLRALASIGIFSFDLPHGVAGAGEVLRAAGFRMQSIQITDSDISLIEGAPT